MRTISIALMAAVLAGGTAFAASTSDEPSDKGTWNRGPLVGSVGFSATDKHDTQVANFTGMTVDLIARNSDVNCESITASFGQGKTRQIFKGALKKNEAVKVDLSGMEAMVNKLDFTCSPVGGPRAQIDVASDATNAKMPWPMDTAKKQ